MSVTAWIIVVLVAWIIGAVITGIVWGRMVDLGDDSDSPRRQKREE